MNIFYLLLVLSISFFDASEQIKSPQKLINLCEEALLPFMQKFSEGKYKDDTQVKKKLRSLPVILQPNLLSSRIFEKIAEIKPLDSKRLYSSLDRYWHEDIALTYIWKDICIVSHARYLDDPRYEIYFYNKKIHTLTLNKDQFIEFIGFGSIIGWKIFDKNAEDQIELGSIDLPILKNSKMNIRRFIVHSNKFCQQESTNFHLQYGYGFLGNRGGNYGVIFDNPRYGEMEGAPYGFTITTTSDLQFSRLNNLTYIKNIKKIYQDNGLTTYNTLSDPDRHLDKCTCVYEKSSDAQWFQFGAANEKYLFAVVEIFKNAEKGPQRFKNVMKLRCKKTWDIFDRDQIFYSRNYIDQIRFIWEDLYIAFVSCYDITLYSLQYKFFFKIPDKWNGFTRILPVFESTKVRSIDFYKEKKFELLLGRGESTQYEHYEFPVLRELDNVWYKKKLIKNKTKKSLRKYAGMPSYFAFLISPEKNVFDNVQNIDL